MTESTTEHGTDPVALDKTDVGAGDAATDDTTASTDTPGRKRGRRARRAAATARAEKESAATGDAAPADSNAADPLAADSAVTESAATDSAEGSEATASTGSATGAASASQSGSRAKSGKSATTAKPSTTDKLSKTRKAARTGKASDTDKRSKTDKLEAGTGKASGAKGTAPRALLDGRRLTRVITGLLVVVILLAALLIVQLIKGPGDASKLSAQEDRQEEARQQAETIIPKLYSFDYRTIDANVNDQGQLTIGSVHDQIQSDTGPALKTIAPKIKAVVQAVSLDSAVLDSSGQDVQVLIFLNQATSSNLLPAPRLDRNRVVATMRQVNGQWKVADIKAL